MSGEAPRKLRPEVVEVLASTHRMCAIHGYHHKDDLLALVELGVRLATERLREPSECCGKCLGHELRIIAETPRCALEVPGDE